MSLPKGISGNPKGRTKKKKRILTELLTKYGDEEFVTRGGVPSTRARETARLVWQMASEGKAEFQDGTVLKGGVRDWKDTVSFIYNQVDGPARLEQDINLSGADAALAQAPIKDLMAIVQSVDISRYLEDDSEDEEEET